MNNRIWILGTVIASLAVIAVGVAIGILPKLTETSINTLELANVQAQNAAYQAELELLKQQFENIDEVRDELEQLQESLPADGDYPGFIEEVAGISQETGVQILETAQTAPIVYGSTATDGSDTGTAAAPISGGTLLAIPYTIKVNSTNPYAVFTFMDRLRLGDRLLLITAYDFIVEEENGVQVYEITISLYIYTLVDPSAVPVDTDGDVPTDPVPTPEATPTETPTPTDSATPTP
jgi:hypothetical protein